MNQAQARWAECVLGRGLKSCGLFGAVWVDWCIEWIGGLSLRVSVVPLLCGTVGGLSVRVSVVP